MNPNFLNRFIKKLIRERVVPTISAKVQAIDSAGTIRVELSPLRSDAAIVVIDTGRGIASEHLPNIFRPFYTTKRYGTGLGLSKLPA
jgi:signal transduction histidine kinase